MAMADRWKRGPVFDAAPLPGGLVSPDAPAFAYSVRLVDNGGDRRLARRSRTRLRSGKILDIANEFLIECQVYDRSDYGARVRLGSDIPPQAALRLYEDDPERLRDVRIVWRSGAELGLSFIRRQGVRRITRIQLICLRDRFYAVDD